jgi:Zn-dependent peptidase ImmA (M78 family)
MTKEQIERMVTNLLSQIGYKEGEVSTEKLRNFINKAHGLRLELVSNLGVDTQGFEILGKIDFKNKVISICTNANSYEKRERFTLPHEIAHYFLKHQKYLLTEYYSEVEFEEKLSSDREISLTVIEDIKKLEWQANYFAASLLIPKNIFLEQFALLLTKEGITNKGHGFLYVDNQKCNLDSFYKITNELKNIFNVSRKAIEIRMIDLELLTDKRSITSNSISNIR